jgi:hypothetical protein
VIYIASPYTHESKYIREERFKSVSYYTYLQIKEGKVVFSPITYGHTLTYFGDLPTDWEFWEKLCISFLDKCNELHILTLEGWEESRGIKMEIEYAKKKGIPIKYIT